MANGRNQIFYIVGGKQMKRSTILVLYYLGVVLVLVLYLFIRSTFTKKEEKIPSPLIGIESVSYQQKVASTVFSINENIYYLDEGKLWVIDSEHQSTIVYDEEIKNFHLNNGCLTINNKDIIECEQNYEYHDIKNIDNNFKENNYIEFYGRYYIYDDHTMAFVKLTNTGERLTVFRYFDENGIPIDTSETYGYDQLIYYKNDDLIIILDFGREMIDYLQYDYFNFETSEKKSGLIGPNDDFNQFCKTGSTFIENWIYVVGTNNGYNTGGHGCTPDIVSANVRSSVVFKIDMNDFSYNEIVYLSESEEFIVSITQDSIYLLRDGKIEEVNLDKETLSSIIIPDYYLQEHINVIRVQDWLFVYGDNDKVLLKMLIAN
ncbi:MAG: hypothetical protein LBR25_08935 [Erysipelotrichaceae bacterium]|nr:hypothetical protein [Erysipelotrichaceae bacterium]